MAVEWLLIRDNEVWDLKNIPWIRNDIKAGRQLRNLEEKIKEAEYLSREVIWEKWP